MTHHNTVEQGGRTPYRAYDYIKGDPGLSPIELAPEFGRVPDYQDDLTPMERSRAKELLTNNLVISFHDHPVLFPQEMAQTPEHYRGGRQYTAYTGLAASGMNIVFDNMMDGTACVTGRAPWRWDDVISDLGLRLADLAHQDEIVHIHSIAEIDHAVREGKIGLVFGLEGAMPIENEVDRLDILFGLGIRQIGVAYSDSNTLGSGLNERTDGGLTAFGRRAVTRMNRLGMAIDLSHSSDKTALDTCSHSDAPVFITHAGARSVWNTPRMKPDEVLRAVAATGGVIGMSAAPHTTISAKHPRHSLESVMDHLLYCIDLVGIEHLAFGPDTLYGDHVQMHSVFGSLLGRDQRQEAPPYEPVSYVDGLENPTENFTNITNWLVKHGFRDDEIRALLGANIYRALSLVWPG